MIVRFRVLAVAAGVALVVGPSLAAWIVVAIGHPADLAAIQPWWPWVAWRLLLTEPGVRDLWGVLSGAALVGGYRLGAAAAADGDTTFGSARWRPAAAYAATLARWRRGRPDNPAGLVVGADPARGPVQAGWVVSRDDHGLLLGAPGSRKSTTVILPTLATIAEAGLSVLVTDPKGELYAAAGGRFQAAGYRVAVLDLRDPAQSARWNPLTPVAAQLAAGRRTDAARTARALAQVLAADGAPAGDAGRFWEQSTTALITALALLVADQAPADQRHLASVYATLIHTANLDAVFAALPPDHPAVQAYGPVKLSGAETRQNQLTVAATTLQLFGDPSVAWLTAADELAVADLAAPGCAVFVVVPDESSAYYGLAALFVQQALAALAEAAAQAPGQRLPRPVHLVLDEFGNLPRLPDFDKALAVARGKGVRITIALQALAQLTARYGPDLGKVMQNSCNTWVYLAGNDWETAETVSRKTGQSTVQTTSRHRLAQGGDQETVTGTGRALLTPDEVLRWPLGTALVLQAGHLPARLPLRRYDAWPGPWDAAPPRTARAVTVPPIWRPDAAAPPPDAYRVVRL